MKNKFLAVSGVVLGALILTGCNKSNDLETRGIDSATQKQTTYEPAPASTYTYIPYSPVPLPIPSVTAAATYTPTTTYTGFKYMGSSCQSSSGIYGFNKFPTSAKVYDSASLITYIKGQGNAECYDFAGFSSLDNMTLSTRFNIKGAQIMGTSTRMGLVRYPAWSGVDAAGIRFRYINFVTAQMPGAQLQGAYFDQCKFDVINLSGANLTNASLNNVIQGLTAEGSGTLLTSARISGTVLNSKFNGAQMQFSNWTNVAATDVHWVSGDLRSAILSYAKVKSTKARPTSTTSINFDGANLNGAKLISFSTAGSTYKISFKGANLTYADLSSADLSMADFSKLGTYGKEADITGITCNSSTKKPTGLSSIQTAEFKRRCGI